VSVELRALNGQGRGLFCANMSPFKIIKQSYKSILMKKPHVWMRPKNCNSRDTLSCVIHNEIKGSGYKS